LRAFNQANVSVANEFHLIEELDLQNLNKEAPIKTPNVAQTVYLQQVVFSSNSIFKL
jgi:hypothetical protein